MPTLRSTALRTASSGCFLFPSQLHVAPEWPPWPFSAARGRSRDLSMLTPLCLLSAHQLVRKPSSPNICVTTSRGRFLEESWRQASQEYPVRKHRAHPAPRACPPSEASVPPLPAQSKVHCPSEFLILHPGQTHLPPPSCGFPFVFFPSSLL